MPKTLFSFFAFIILSLSIVSPVSGQTVIQMEKDGGVYKIPCEINGLRLKLIFDTGASNVCISESIAVMMLENGYLEKEDIKGSGSSIVADGRIVDNTQINIKSLKIGELTLNNVEAVVMHHQSAPLLLGQSAIQKLGTVSISGDKLILNNNSHTYQTTYTPMPNLTLYDRVEAASLARKAEEAYNNDYYELAAQYYSDSYKLCDLNIYQKKCYADCLIKIDKYNEALSIYMDIISKKYIIQLAEEDIYFKVDVYFGILVCHYSLMDYQNAILVGQMILPKINFDNEKRDNIVFFIAMSYNKIGDTYKSKQTFLNEINSYLAYMEISATDCWDKGYKDPYIADLYYGLHLISEDFSKYLIIAAAWGDKDAIQCAKELSFSYSQKPNKYVY